MSTCNGRMASSKPAWKRILCLPEMHRKWVELKRPHYLYLGKIWQNFKLSLHCLWAWRCVIYYKMLLCFIIQCPSSMEDKISKLTMSITIFLKDCLCFLVKFWKMSQFSSCSSLKPTAKWWFSSTDESLYIKASSESVVTIAGQNVTKTCASTKSLETFYKFITCITRFTDKLLEAALKVTELFTE